MTDTAILTQADQGLSDEDIETMTNSLGWSIWALKQAADITAFPTEDLLAEMAAEPEYAEHVVEVFKMMAFERALMFARERIVEDIFRRLRIALTRANRMPAGNVLTIPIDFTKLHPCAGLHPDDIHVLRPKMS